MEENVTYWSRLYSTRENVGSVNNMQVCLCAGMLRWTLHRKVQKNPANSLSLVTVLIKELEKVLDLTCKFEPFL